MKTEESVTQTVINSRMDGYTLYREPEPKSKLLVGNMTIFNTKHFNWLNRIMFKIFFGITIKNIKENK